MAQSAADLQQLKGVGKILAKRLHDAGFDTFQKVADAGETELKKIPGISPRAISSILEQAREFAQSPPDHPGREEAVRKQLRDVREKVLALAEMARDRFQDRIRGKTGKKLASELVRIDGALERMEGGGRKRIKRAGKALTKAGERLTTTDDASLKKIRKSLKKVRKTVVKAL